MMNKKWCLCVDNFLDEEMSFGIICVDRDLSGYKILKNWIKNEISSKLQGQRI